MKKTIASILTITGFISFLISLMSAYYAITSFIERARYGPGLFFADVEIFVAITLFFIVAGSFCLWISHRIRKHNPPRQ
jgi:sorbitol-specific phosphotransferase system component IIC